MTDINAAGKDIDPELPIRHQKIQMLANMGILRELDAAEDYRRFRVEIPRMLPREFRQEYHNNGEIRL